jgi:ArsR family transcriptional regulator
MVKIFKALSDETRLRILSLVWNEDLCVCEIEMSLKLTQSNASKHLTIFKDAGILLSYKQKQWSYYKINEEFLKENKELCEYLNLRFKELPNYKEDIKQMKSCKAQNLCDR